MKIPDFRSPVEGAMWMHDQGFKVFPVKPGDKVPLVKNWQDWAKTAARGTIETYYTPLGMPNWGVYLDASGYCVIDVDVKGKENGLETLAALEAKFGKLPITLKVKTPSGGYHYYFKGRIPSTRGKLGPGIDTRGVGGYVLALGSVINDRPYERVA